ncbi:MAG: chromosome segregation protein SMC [Vampirovibrionales bacterium]|nr:chromosome segregation protein SMC [Vampirovibrionales bacterium]
MHICEIVIDNFKSFSGKTVIPFEKGFTTISGPNGSGKSNIIDSILFCLGLSTSRTMRAEKLTDLINHHSQRKSCEVTITFQRDEHEAALPVGFLGDRVEGASDSDPLTEGTTLQVTRKIKVTSSGPQSQYLMNGRSSTLTEIHDVLGRYHVSPGSFNVMMQGDVQGFVNMSPMERRKIIDEIAGVADFDRKIDQAKKEMEKTAENVDRNSVLLQEIEGRLAQLADERKTALTYQKLKRQKHGWETKRLAARFVDTRKALEATEANRAEAIIRQKIIRQQLNTLEQQVLATREALRSASEAVKQKGEDQHIALRSQMESLKGHMARKQDTIAFNQQKIAENTQQTATVQASIARHKESIDGMEATLATLQQQLAELKPLYDAEATQYQTHQAKMDRLTASTGELGVQRNELRDTLREAEDALSALQRELMTLESEVNRRQMETELQQSQQSNAAQQRTTLQAEEAQLLEKITPLSAKLSTIESDIQRNGEAFSQAQAELNKATDGFAKASGTLMQLDAQQRAYQEMNYARPVEMIMAANISGVHGPLGELAEVDGDSATAIEVALGGRVQNVVVQDDRVASDAIEYLKQQRGGRATLLPLNKLQPARRLPPLPRVAGLVDYAINLIRYDSRFTDAFAYALGDTLVVESLDAARPLLRQYRMVTMDGELLEKSGAMTGGSLPTKSQGRLSATKRLADDIEVAKIAATKAATQKKAATELVDRLSLLLEALKHERAEINAQLADAKATLKAIQQQLAQLPKAVDADEKDSSLAFMRQTFERKQQKLAEHQALVQGLLAQRDALDAKLPTADLAKLQQAMSDVKFQMDYYDSQMRNVQTDIQGKTMEREYQQVGIGEYEQRLQEVEASNKALAKGIEDAQEEIQLTEQQLKGLEAQSLELDHELKHLQAERDAVQNQLIEEEKAKGGLERDVNQLAEQLLAYDTRRRELQPQVVEARQLLLVQVNQGLAEQNTQTTDGSTTPDAPSSEVEVVAAVDWMALHPETLETAGNEANLPSEAEIQQQVEKLEKRMTALEPVNMRAITDYDSVAERKGELAEKIQTLSDESQAIQIRISGYEELKKASFRKAFDEIDGHFRTIFETLADGDGHLTLSNPEDPLNSGMTLMARPRGKKMQRIEAMSGGEKSLTSLAFVFALQRTMPAPFYALDEVDMNLDGINVEKLANMVVQESQKASQFLVVSLRKPMIERSQRTIGVTQKPGGKTHVTGIRIRAEVVNHHLADEIDAPTSRKSTKQEPLVAKAS